MLIDNNCIFLYPVVVEFLCFFFFQAQAASFSTLFTNASNYSYAHTLACLSGAFPVDTPAFMSSQWLQFAFQVRRHQYRRRCRHHSSSTRVHVGGGKFKSAAIVAFIRPLLASTRPSGGFAACFNATAFVCEAVAASTAAVSPVVSRALWDPACLPQGVQRPHHLLLPTPWRRCPHHPPYFGPLFTCKQPRTS